MGHDPLGKFGFSYATKVRYGKLDGYYKDTLLTASGGRMNMPEQFDMGVSYQLTDQIRRLARLQPL
ncbi:MAG: hypothetical protein ACSLEN_05940 [Candidatus Malihini olakiniferum]